MGFDPHLAALGEFQVSYVLELHRWNEAAQLSPVDGASDWNHSFTYLARAIGAARSGNPDQARREIEQLEKLQNKFKPDKKKDRGQYESVVHGLAIARAWLAPAQGHHDDALALLRPLADKQEGEAEASEGIPVHEMIADMLLESKRPAEALAEYEATLKTDPGRFNSLYGAAQAAEQIGQKDKSREYYAQLLKNCEGSKSDRAELKHAREHVDQQTARSGPPVASRNRKHNQRQPVIVNVDDRVMG